MKTIVTHITPSKNYYFAEAIKSLRTNVEFSGMDNKIIVLTSCVPNEGKSTLSVQLALALAETGKRVAFVDADLRKRAIMGRYRVKGKLDGLTTYLAGRCEKEDIIFRTENQNFYMIFSGPVTPNPSELLNSERFSNLMKDLRSQYDYVIVDSPPIGLVIDAAVISRSCDAAILVCASGQVSRRIAQDAKKQIEQSGVELLGVVLNKVPMATGHGYYGKYYGKYYGHYGRYGEYGDKPEE